MTEPEYIAYFEGLASKHKAIRHLPGEESSQAFYLVQDDNMTELDQAVKNKLQLPALLLDQYVDELDTTQDNNRLRIEGGISIICKFQPGDTESFREARHQARLIARSILNRLRKELRPGGGLSAMNMVMLPVNAGEPTPILGGNATGWGYAITWQLPTNMAVSADEWFDL